MAKVRPNAIIATISGKLARGEDVYLATNKRTGRVYAVQVIRPYRGPWSDKQVAHRKAFGERSKTAAAWLAANDPKRNGGEETAEYKAMLRKYNRQNKTSNIMAFVVAHYENGKIKSFIRK